MPKIKILDELTIQKIAAGEIIERPSSIIKELVENSLDAGSSNITIEIIDGGKTYIRVTDDGHGILEEDLNIAFKRHSTSKLSKVDDLHKINSLGFRGEALASISTVSKVEVLTKVNEDLPGIQVFIEEGKIIKKQPIGCPKGTTMIIKDIFYNIPARKNFLDSDLVESNHINNIIYKLALGNPGISFKYIKDNKVVFKTSKNNNLISNVYSLLGKEFSKNLIKIHHKDLNFELHGYISKNTFYRGNRSHQYLYVNNRYIESKDISNLVEKQYKSIIPINRFPVFILFIDISPSLIDVNIHPTKQQIKFINQKEIYIGIEYIINKELNEVLTIPKANLEQNKKVLIKEELPLLFEPDFFKEKNESEHYNGPKNYIEKSYDLYEDKKTIDNKEGIIHKNQEVKEDSLKDILERIKLIGVLFSTYILVEDPVANNLLIMDQHAAHERIMYERFKKEYENEKIVVQNILTPEIIDLTNTEFSIVMNNIKLLRRLGFIVEEFGANSVIIRGVPILFGNPNISGLFLELVDTLKTDIKSSYDTRLDKIIKMSCTNAIKSGDNIKDIEIESLFKQLSKVENPYTCPHGRPTIIEFSKKYIEKEFKRIM